MTDRPFLGILLMLGFCVLAPLGDATAKMLGERMSVGFLVFVRFLAQAVIFSAMLVLFRLALPKGRSLWSIIALRTALHICGLGMMFAALQFLPLADAIAIAFVMPFLMLLLGKVFLGEVVGPARLWACAVGFIGTLMVVQPNFAEVGAPALLPLGVAVVFSLFMLVTRVIAKDVDPVSLQALSGLMAMPPLVLALWLFEGGPFFEITQIQGSDWGLLVLLGLLGAAAHLMMTWSLRFAPSATLAPMQYLEIPFATCVGYVIFRDLPNGLAALGICVTIAAGLFIILRERAMSRQPQPEPAP